MLRFLDWFLPPALRDGDADPRRRARVLAAVALVLGMAGLVLTATAAVLQLWANAAGTSIGLILPFMLLWMLRRGTSITLLGGVAGGFVLIIVVQGALAFGGLGSPPLNWLATLPLLVLLVSGPRLGIAFAFVAVLAHTAFFLWGGHAEDIPALGRYLDGVAGVLVVFGLAFGYETFKRRALIEIRDAHAQIEALQAQLVERAHAAGMAEIATSVVHDAGNALNHVSTAVGLANESIAGLQIERLDQVSRALTSAARGDDDKKLASYVTQVADLLRQQQAAASAELARLVDGIEHMSAIIASHQQHAGNSQHVTIVDLKLTIEAVLYLERSVCEDLQVELVVELEQLPPVRTSKYKIVLVFTNLLRNALAAVIDGAGPRQIRVHLHRPTETTVRLEVHDTGVGIATVHATQIFRHGFTTKPKGHGFGLHSSAVAAGELGGTLTFHSDGPGRGATFALELPFAPA